jgi:manganese/iron transport system substrate-binding protein
MKKRWWILVAGGLLGVFFLSACTNRANPAAVGKPIVVATTTIIGDVVSEIGKDNILLKVMLPVEADPHAFEPTPKDIASASDADIIFANGAGLEGFLETILKNAGGAEKVILLSDGIQLLEGAPEDPNSQTPGSGNITDPHVWFDPTNVMIWSQHIADALASQDPDHADAYHTNADAYRSQLSQLDAWIVQQVDQVPPNRRKLVTDHESFAYFAARYGFEQVGAVLPSYSSLSSSSAQELAALEDKIRNLGTTAIFVGKTVNPTLAEQVAADTGSQIVYLYTGSLSTSNGPAATYIEMMHYDVTAIVSALK